MKKPLTLVAIAICMLAVPQFTYTAKPVYATQATIAKTVGTVTANSSLNLRKTDIATSEVLTSIPKNAQVSIISKNASNWYNVTYDGKTGWVSGAYLAIKSVAVEPVVTEPTTNQVGIITANPSLNLRKTDVATSAVLTTIPKNAQISILSKNASNWYNVTYDGKTGWISGAYLRTASPLTPVVSRGEPAQTVERRVMRVSAYTIGDKGMNGEGITASGEKVLAGRTIAAHSGIPLGTQIYIPELGKTFTVTDRGGSIQEDQLDMFMESQKEALEFGTRELEVHIK
ncbi:MAG TPA: hypothetical protein DD730_04565 [Desulfosporosinus sp.]|nr:hypothetical protein [Desulfosporosinus sp.]